jgi:hypothetical protein
MALDLYAKEDILNVLHALHVSSEVPTALAVGLVQDRELAVGERDCEALAGQSALAQERMVFYQKGFRTALASVALAFGLVPVSSSSPASGSHTMPSRSTDRYEVDLRSFVESMVRSEA